jgi:hypothetical protein
MWERPTDHEASGSAEIEIPMFVLSVEVPEAEPIDDTDFPAPVDPALIPRQGTGTWPNGERAVRLGNAEEILITLPSNPFAAMDVARAGDVFTPPIPSLRVDLGSRRDGDFEVSWQAALRAPLLWRKVSLRIYASPSLNVTVMTIVPDKARKISSRWFVHMGLKAARQLAQQIELALPLIASLPSATTLPTDARGARSKWTGSNASGS